jgi:hypothetical protein
MSRLHLDRMVKVNIVVKIYEEHLVKLEDRLNDMLPEVVSYRVLPDTEKLYDDSKTFRSLLKKRKEIQNQIDEYINEYG